MNQEFSKNNELSYNLIKERYLKPLKINPDLFIGIELEFPIVHKEALKTDTSVSKKLLVYLEKTLELDVLKRDKDGNIVHLKNLQTDDEILFEVSYNTLEFAFGKSTSITEIDKRFERYFHIIQNYLADFNHEIRGIGINPQWEINDNRAVSLPRYEMLIKFLKMGEVQPRFHKYPDYASFICSSQVQFDVSKENYLTVLNLFNLLEPVKAYLFSNSLFPKAYPEVTISRDIFWEQSMHGYFKENVGVYPNLFTAEDEWINYMLKTAIFYTVRNETIYYFTPIRVKDYLNKDEIVGYDLKGNRVSIIPKAEDLKYHRSYHYQVLTTRGTVEVRSICTQSFEKTFAPAAFHLGLLENLSDCEKIILNSFLLTDKKLSFQSGRRYFSQIEIDENSKKQMLDLAKKLVTCAKEGLRKRGRGEEIYLDNLNF